MMPRRCICLSLAFLCCLFVSYALHRQSSFSSRHALPQSLTPRCSTAVFYPRSWYALILWIGSYGQSDHQSAIWNKTIPDFMSSCRVFSRRLHSSILTLHTTSVAPDSA
ncbi:hypothetical protein BDQ12DRAFT_690109 [Crucibulum laeve]|uniref:Secreted protein n=1 Tax=Crucibulum laeve TaxID=68775 RepID=A0A5C3LM23_9AGAR|nr:hypothetical protein BDQ12DRAFT_690109 [Crucibulum laeve]